MMRPGWPTVGGAAFALGAKLLGGGVVGPSLGAELPLLLQLPFSLSWSLLLIPLVSGVIGYVTNWVALKIIFLPYEERKIGPVRLQGLFIRRQPEVSETYSSIIADEIITMDNIGDNLLHGRQSDRTRTLIRSAVRPVVDDALGRIGPAVHVMAGAESVEGMRETAADQGVEVAGAALRDPEFSRARSDAIRGLLVERMKQLPPTEYAPMLRAAFREDEWLLVLIGAALGFVAGWLQLLLVTAL